MAVTEHLYSLAVVLPRADIWEAMIPADRKIFEDAFAEVSVYERQVSREAEAGLAAQGLQVTRPDKAAFRQAVADVKKDLSRNFSAIVTRRHSDQD